MAEALTEIKTHLARMDDLVQDYLPSCASPRSSRPPWTCGRLVTELAQEITPALTAHGITLQLEALDQLGMVRLHAHTFRRALLNLVQNAIEAMPQDGTLTLRGRRQATTVSIDVGYRQRHPPEHMTQILSRCRPRNRGHRPRAVSRAGGGGRAWRPGGGAVYVGQEHVYDHAAAEGT